MENTIVEATFRELLVANSIDSVAAVGREGGFVVTIGYGGTERILASARGSARVFPNLTKLATFLRNLGAATFIVKTEGYVTGRVRKARPDRAAALRKTRTTPRQISLLEENK
ncbi:hypothetical protein LFL96_01175 [Paraburkholderia sp. D15]|uniref:hypothetical protein n=1 Tax=Paraburkholderia sp. D15 TaxID=2880218 RepID=UPI00247ACD4B|nr:hypothetical protein [Paraburkholderia sp. D15]WGS50150.1 hypothetical protein LFL96_01175 [Paraburkholderia sp. D15]